MPREHGWECRQHNEDVSETDRRKMLETILSEKDMPKM